MAYDVKVKIDLTKVAGKLGFGIPLILAENAASAVAYTEVSNVAEVVAAGFAAETNVYKAAQLAFGQPNAPATLAVAAVEGAATTFLTDAKNIAKGWRQLVVVNAGEAAASTVQALSTAVEALDGKMYFASLDTDSKEAVTTDGVTRTVLFYCNATENVPVPAAALAAEAAGRDPGSFTYKNLKLSGVEAQDLTDAQVAELHAKGGITYVTKAGDSVTSEGKVLGGEYIDIVDSEDYIIQQLTYKTQKLLNSAAKVPYDNNGIAMLESVAVDVLRDAFNKGMIAIAEDGAADYSVSYALREETAASDRAARKYIGGTFRFALAGAIHEVEITGTIDI